MSSHRTSRHTARHAARHATGYRRRPSRLTLAVAAATVASAAVVASISVGITLAAANGPSTSSQAAGHATLSAQRASSSGGSRAGYGRADAARAVAGKAASGKTGSGKAAPAKAAPAKSAQHKVAAAVAHKGSAQGHRPAATKAPASQGKPYLIYDSVIPQAIPAGQVVATYSTGAHPIPVSAVAGRRTVLWIDTLATDPSGSGALDIEPGCASPSQAAGWVRARLTAHPTATAILYSSISEWSTVQADVATLPSWMRAKIRWWIADPTGSPHIVPGSQATQWSWGSSYDVSTALPGFTS